MSWFNRMFGNSVEDEIAKAQARSAAVRTEVRGDHPDVPIERQGLEGEYDQSGLAKRVVRALEDADVEYIETLWVAQKSNTIVLKGSVPNQNLLDQIVEIAGSVTGTSSVETDQVSVEG